MMLRQYLEYIYNEAATDSSDLRKEVALDLEAMSIPSSMTSNLKIRSEKMNFKTTDEKEILKILKSATHARFEIVKTYSTKDSGGYSNKYLTYRFKLLSKYKSFKPGETFLMANAQASESSGSGASSDLTEKQLTPVDLNLNGTYKNASGLISAIKKSVNAGNYNDSIKQLLIQIINLVSKAKIETHNKVNGGLNIQDGHGDMIDLDQASLDLIQSIHPADLAVIGKNFGEVVDGIYIFKKYMIPPESDDSIVFPAEGNAKLIDLIANDVVSISSKYKTGGSPSITAITKKINDEPKRFKHPALQSTIKLLDIFSKETSLSGSLKAARLLNLKIWQAIEKLISPALSATGTSRKVDDNIRRVLNELILNKYKKLNNDADALHAFLTKNIWSLARGVPSVSAKDLKIKIKNNRDLAGLIMYPLQSELIKNLNDKSQPYLKAITNIAKILRVKQIYLDFKINTRARYVSFKIKDFTNNEFAFDLNTSVNDYTGAKIAFKMK